GDRIAPNAPRYKGAAHGGRCCPRAGGCLMPRGAPDAPEGDTMNGQYTPGPWHTSDNGEHLGYRLIYAPDGYLVADAGRIQRRTDAEQDANARLIAAAPELVEALRDAR